MSDQWSGKLDELKSRIKGAVGNEQGEIDSEVLLGRIRETVGKAGSDLDADALVARVRGAVSNAEGKIDTEKLRQWADEVDRDKLKGWLDEAKTMASGAATMVEGQVAERAPGALDKVLGVAREKIGDFIGDESLAREGELQHLKGDIQERFAAADAVEREPTDTTEKHSG